MTDVTIFFAFPPLSSFVLCWLPFIALLLLEIDMKMGLPHINRRGRGKRKPMYYIFHLLLLLLLYLWDGVNVTNINKRQNFLPSFSVYTTHIQNAYSQRNPEKNGMWTYCIWLTGWLAAVMRCNDVHENEMMNRKIKLVFMILSSIFCLDANTTNTVLNNYAI